MKVEMLKMFLRSFTYRVTLMSQQASLYLQWKLKLKKILVDFFKKGIYSKWFEFNFAL